MSKSNIEWTDETWNPVTGCTKVSAGCKHCYAEREWPRMTKLVPAYAGRDFTDVRCHPERLEQPLRWKRPRKVFVNSMSDLFYPDVPDAFIDQVFAVMAIAPQHTFQVLTKRPERMLLYFKSYQNRASLEGVGIQVPDCVISRLQGRFSMPELALPLPNVWLGVSVEHQETAEERIPLLLQTPAAVRWISAEPLLGPIDVWQWLGPCVFTGKDAVTTGRGLDWIVAGGESGPQARPMHPDWVRSLRDQCAEGGVPFLFKQWGEWEVSSFANGHYDCDMARNAAIWLDVDGTTAKPSSIGLSDQAYAMVRVGKKKAGRLLDGELHNEYPFVNGGAA